MSKPASRMRLSMFSATRQAMKASALAVCSGVRACSGLNHWALMRRAAMARSGKPSIPALAERLRQAGDLRTLLGRPGREQLVERLAVAAGQGVAQALEQVAEVRRVAVLAV